MTDLFNRIERSHGYKLLRWWATATVVKNIIGPDAVGQYWDLRSGSAGAAVAGRLDRKGEVLSTHTIGGSSYPVGAVALDKYGFPWFGSTGQIEVIKLGFDGTALATLTLSDGVDGYRPTGALGLGDYVYFVAVNDSTADIRLFCLSIVPGAEAIFGFGSALASAGAVVERMDLVGTGTGKFWCTDPNRTGDLIEFDINSLEPVVKTLTWSVGAATAGLMGIHKALGNFWVGGDTLDSVGASPPQLIQIDSSGDVVNLLQFTDALRVSDIKSDSEYLYAAVTGKSGVTTVGDNRIVKLSSGLSLEESFLFDGGDGEELRTLLVVSDEAPSPYPEPTLVDAEVWVRADDPGLSLVDLAVSGAPNRGPQGRRGDFSPRAAASRPALGALPGMPAFLFDGSDDELPLLACPSYSILSTRFDGVSEYATAGSVLDFNYNATFSVSCWFKTTDADGYLVSKVDGTPTGYGMFVNSIGQLRFVLANSLANKIEVDTVDAFNDGIWHHVVTTWDGNGTPGAGGVTIYVDGQSVSVSVVTNTLGTNPTTNSADFRANGDGVGGLLIAALVDEIGVYDKELLSSEVEEIFADGAPVELSALSTVGNLIGWWRMGDGDTAPKILSWVAGGSAYPTIPDESGSGNDGTMTGMLASNVQTSVPWGKFCKYSFTFNGTNQYITMGNVIQFEYNLPFSISFWFRSTDTEAYLVSKMETTPGNRGYGVALTIPGKLVFNLVSTGGSIYSQIITDDTFNDNEWHHVVCTYSAATPGAAADMNIIVDGVDVPTTVGSSTLGSNTILNSAAFNLASRTNGAVLYAGFLTEVALYDKQLSLVEAQWVYNSGEPRDLRLPAAPSMLAAWWRLGAAMDTPQSSWTHKIQQWVWPPTTKESATITDAGPFASPGTLYNMVAGDVTTDTPGGISNYSCTFDGINKAMFCNVASTLYGAYDFSGSDCFSLSGWVKTTATSGWLWGNANNTNPAWQGYGVYLDGSGRVAFALAVSFGGTQYVIRTTSATVNDGSWHHVVVTTWRRGTNDYVTEIYIDGAAQTLTLVANNNGNSSISGSGFSIGARNSGLYTPLAGQCDEVSVWNKFLSQNEVDAIFNSGAPADLRDTPCVDHLRGWWRMGDPYAYAGASVNMNYYNKYGLAPGTPVYTNRSLYFDSSNDYVAVGNVPEIDFEYNEPFSVSAWILPWGINAYRNVANKCTGYTNSGWMIDYYGGSGGATYYPYGFIRVVFTSVSGTGQGFFEVSPGCSGRPLAFAVWQHLVVTYDGSNDANGIKFYINGEPWPTQVRYNTTFVASLRNATAFNIGGTYGYWSGFEDEVSVWDKELSQADVTEIYNGGDPDDLSGHTSVANLVGWWRMGEFSPDMTMVNMGGENFLQDVPRPIDRLALLHDGSSYTLAIAFRATGSGPQTLLTTIGSAIDTADVGTSLVFDATNETLRFVIANGGGTGYVVDKTTATGTVPVDVVVVVSVRVDFGSTPEAEIRIWTDRQYSGFVEETAALLESPVTAPADAFVLGGTGAGALDGELGEGVVIGRKLPDPELEGLVKYLMRAMA